MLLWTLAAGISWNPCFSFFPVSAPVGGGKNSWVPSGWSSAMGRAAWLAHPGLLRLLGQNEGVCLWLCPCVLGLPCPHQPALSALRAAEDAGQMWDLLLLSLLWGLPQIYFFLFYCVIPTAKMTLSQAQTAIKHRHLASRKIKMQQEEKAAGERNHWET